MKISWMGGGGKVKILSSVLYRDRNQAEQMMMQVIFIKNCHIINPNLTQSSISEYSPAERELFPGCQGEF